MDKIQSTNFDKVKKPKDPKKVAQFVVEMFNKLQQQRQTQIDEAMELQKWAAMNQEPLTIFDTKGEEVKGFKDNKFATIVEVLTAQIGNQSWTNMSQMFDVRCLETMPLPDNLTENEKINYLENEEIQKEFFLNAEEKAKKQKIALEQSLYKMNADVQLEKCFRTGDLFYGEKISQIGWKQKNIVQKLYGGKENVINYDNAHIQAVDPIAFVFDTDKYVKDDDDSFKQIVKIHKRFESIDSILSRKYTNTEGKIVNLYNLSSQDVENIKNKKEKNTTDVPDNQADDLKIKEAQVGDTYATYFMHGDFEIDGVEFKNYIAEVFADEFLIRFEPNPIYINPFIIQMDNQDPITKRGIPRLKTIIDSCKMRQMYINQKQQKDYLNSNPPAIMTGSLKNKLFKGLSTMQWTPGLILDIDDLAQDLNNIRKETFDTKGDIENIQFVTKEISDNGAVNANAMGNVEAGANIKATDLQLAKQGQDIRTQQTLESIYKFTLKNVEAIAQIKALFQSGIEIFNVKDKNANRLYAINDIIRQGQYEYRYEDRNALINRHSKLTGYTNRRKTI